MVDQFKWNGYLIKAKDTANLSPFHDFTVGPNYTFISSITFMLIKYWLNALGYSNNYMRITKGRDDEAAKIKHLAVR